MPKPEQTTLPLAAIEHMSTTAGEHVPDNVAANLHPELVVAFTDLNGNNNWDGANVDRLIAAILDTNNDTFISPGDTVTFGTYPDVNGIQAGTFQGADTTITNVQIATSTEVLVDVTGGTVRWVANSGVEVFRTTASGNLESSFFDGIAVGTLNDQIFVDSTLPVTGPGEPDTSLVSSIARPAGDDGFLDVFIA